MRGFSWSQWLGRISRVALSKSGRRPRRVSLPRIEGLEDRALLTAPVAVNDVYEMDANTSLNGASVLINDTDADGDDITQAILGNSPANGSFSLAIDGTFTYTPTSGFTGTDSFTYTARTANGESSSNQATVVIHVGTGNQAPTANSSTFSTPINTELIGTVTGSDPNGDPLQFFGGSQTTSHGFVSLTFEGEFTYTPDAGFTGQDSFTFVANDGQTNSAEATITINVGNANNDAPVAESISRSIDIDEVLTDQLSATDADGDTLTFEIGATSPLHGDVTINTDGSFTYTPDPGFSGSDSFTFVANDGTEDSDEATVSISIGSAGNTAPVADSATASTAIDTVLNGTLTASDADNDPLTFELGSQSPAHGAVVISSNGSFTYTPASGFTGTDTFTFVANDGTTDSAEATVTINVGNSSGNDAPVANSAAASTDVNTVLNGTLTATDADGDPLTFALGNTTTTHGSVVVNSNGSFTYTPDNNFTGTDTFTFVANDGTTDSAEATITITVGTTGNTPPVATSESVNTPINTELAGTLHATDADGDTLTFAAGDTQPTHGTVLISSNGNFTYTPDNGFSGTDSFSFVANDGTIDSAEATITITVGSTGGNTAPVPTSETLTTPVDTTLTGTVHATDADGDVLIFARGTTQPAHGSLTLNANGSFVYRPDSGFQGTDTFTFVANDGTVNSAEGTITINVGTTGGNTAPVATSANLNTDINTTLNGNLQATDADGDTLTFELGTTTPAHGTVVVDTDGSFTYTPDNGFTGTDSFTFVANDGTVDSAAATITIDVGDTGGNSPPLAVSASASTSVNTVLHGVLHAIDADNDPLTFQIGNTSPLHGSVTINPNGSFDYSPDAGFTGTDSFTFVANDGTTNSGEGTITITVGGTSGNNAPVATSATFGTTINTSVTGTLHASDADGDTLTFAVGSNLPSHGSVFIQSNGSFTYTPDTGFIGTDSFTFVANDGTTNSAEAAVTINVGSTSGNTPPVAIPASLSTPVNVILTGNLTGFDANGDTLTFSTVTIPSHGTLVLDANGSFTYTPHTGFTGTDTFFFRVNDGTFNSGSALVTVTVSNTGTSNTPPVANSQSLTINPNGSVSGTLTGSDADGDSLIFLAGSIQPQNGSVTIAPSGAFSYTPDFGFTGDDTFSFRVNDGTINSSEAFVTIHVQGTATIPTADPTTISTAVNTAFHGTLTGSDPNGDALTFLPGTIQPAHGTVTINPGGSFIYNPDAGFSGNDQFTFKVNDGTADSLDATVIVHVGTVVNTSPMAFPQTINVDFETTFDGQLNALDVDGDVLTFSAGTVSAAHGAVVINDDGSFTYTPDNGYIGDDLFSFNVNDGTASSIEALVTVHVATGTSTGAPTVSAGSGDLNADEDFVSSLAPLAFDPDGDTLTFQIVSNPAHGTVSLSDDGNFIYTPNNGFNGVDSFVFKANDGTHDSNTATFTLNVGDTTPGAFDLQLSAASSSPIATSRKSVTPLDPAASLVNVTDNVDFRNTDLRASIIAGADSHDKLVVTDRDGGPIDVRGKRVFFNGVEVARLSGGKHGDALRVAFNSSASLDAVNAVLRHVGIRTTKRASTATRTIEMRVNADGVVSTATIDASMV